MAMAYGNVYVARVAMGANPQQTLRAFREAEAYDGPVADHRLQPLHRPRHRHAPRPGAAEAGPCQRLLAAVSATTPRCGAPARTPSSSTRRADDPAQDYAYNEAALPHARAHRSRRRRAGEEMAQLSSRKWKLYEELATRVATVHPSEHAAPPRAAVGAGTGPNG